LERTQAHHEMSREPYNIQRLKASEDDFAARQADARQ
jgi:hypothetical protein